MEPDAVSLTACVHCGLCLPACPTFRVLGDENDSPRGRLYLMKAREENRLSSPAVLRIHLGRCLSCRACETACPADVPYSRLLERARASLTESRPLAHRASRLLLWLLTGAPSRPLYGALRLARRSGLARLARRMPGRIGRAALTLEASSPATGALTDARFQPTRDRASDAESGSAAALLEGSSAAARPEGSSPSARPEGSPSAFRRPRGDSPSDAPSWGLLEGCVTRGLFSHVQAATRRVVGRLGWKEVAVTGPLCCGALHAHAGHRENARRLARRTIAAFEASGADRVVSDAAGCSAAMKEFGPLLGDDPRWADRARRFAERVRDVSELLGGTGFEDDSRIDSGDPRVAAAESLAATVRPVRIAYDAPCHLLHAQGIDRAPVEALRAVGEAVGLSVEPLASSSECCGGAGTYGLRLPRLSTRILARKLDEIQAGGYDAVVTGNPGCILQIGAGLKERGDGTPVLHPVEIVARAASARVSAPTHAPLDE